MTNIVKVRPAVMPIDSNQQVCQELARHHYLSARQINRLVFRGPARSVRRRLALLLRDRLIARLATMQQPDHGVPSCLYHLTKRGAELTAAQLGFSIPSPTPRGRSLRFMAHHVQCVNFYVALTEALALRNATARHHQIKVLQWQHEWQLKIPQARGVAKAERVMIRGGRPVTLLPDAFFELGVPGGDSYFFFCEIDMGTHPLKVWRDRALAFTEYGRPERGLFRRRFGSGQRDTFRLLIVTPRDFRGRSRCNNILATIEETVGPTNLFLGATLPDIMPPTQPTTAGRPGRKRDQLPQPSAAILKPIWRPVGGGRPGCLLPTVRVRE